jgi:SAM-dependent methyltransferase
VSWQRFEREAAGYEAWYATPRGRRADRAERGLLERLMVPFATARSALEIGCGTGHFTQWLAGRLPSVVGLDHAPAMLAQARRDPRLRLVRGDAHQLPFRNRAVDLSVFVTTLEFLEHPALAATLAGPCSATPQISHSRLFASLRRQPQGRGSASSGGRAPCSLAASPECQRGSHSAASSVSPWS